MLQPMKLRDETIRMTRLPPEVWDKNETVLKGIILSEQNQSQKVIYYIIPFM